MFGGLLVKEETADAELTLTHNFKVCTDSFTGGTIDFATEASRSIMIEDWQIDPALLDQPATQPLLPHATKVVPAPPSKHKVSCVSFDTNDELDSGNTSKQPRTLVSAGTKTLDGYFFSGRIVMRPRELHRPVTEGHPAVTSAGISNAITQQGHPAITSDRPVISGATAKDCPSAGISNVIT